MPATSADAVRLLGTAEVDDDAVRANVSLLGDLDAFVSSVAAWAVAGG